MYLEQIAMCYLYLLSCTSNNKQEILFGNAQNMQAVRIKEMCIILSSFVMFV